MDSIFSNGPTKDFVINPFTDLTLETAQLYIAAPYVTETGQLLSAAKNGVSVKLRIRFRCRGLLRAYFYRPDWWWSRR
jgi:hypothetical protein